MRCDGGLRQRVSTRKADDLVAALGAESGISKSEVSRISAELDRELPTPEIVMLT
jgi:transposase-like protein